MWDSLPGVPGYPVGIPTDNKNNIMKIRIIIIIINKNKNKTWDSEEKKLGGE
jgi:hypothetical protein